MCEFCAQHGEGQAWYLTMKNYGQEFLAHQERREHIITFSSTLKRAWPNRCRGSMPYNRSLLCPTS